MPNLRLAAAAAALAMALASTTALAQSAPSSPAPSATAPRTANPDLTEMRRALYSLYTSERHLGRVTQDFDGHRAKALELVRQAETELQAVVPPRRPRAQKTPAPATKP